MTNLMAEAETKEAHTPDWSVVGPKLLDLACDFVGWVERFTGTVPAGVSDEMFGLYGRARSLHLRADRASYEAAQARFRKVPSPSKEAGASMLEALRLADAYLYATAPESNEAQIVRAAIQRAEA